jgi:hypothetical protein
MTEILHGVPQSFHVNTATHQELRHGLLNNYLLTILERKCDMLNNTVVYRRICP